jgi:hypothetical protein
VVKALLAFGGLGTLKPAMFRKPQGAKSILHSAFGA